jgi:ATP-binding cassette subfamily B multidrug efflux pump
MFRFFETLVDPYVDYRQTDIPPQRLWPFLREYALPFRRVLIVTAGLKVAVAAVEILMVWYVARIVDLLAQGEPQLIWSEHGAEFLLAALFVLIARPIIAGIDVALLHNTILPNFGTLIRWRSHRHVLR